MSTNVEKIVTTVSQKVIIPALCEGLSVDARSLFFTRPGSSNLYLESVTKEVANVIVKTIIDALDEEQDSHKLGLMSALDLPGPSKMCVTDLGQLDSFTESEVSQDAQSAHRQCSSDTSLISELLVDHLVAYIKKVSGSSFRHGIPANALDGQIPSFLGSLSAKSLQKIQREHTRTKAAQEVSKILFMTSDSFLESSLHSQRAHTSRGDGSVERSPSECLFKAFDLVDSVIDRISERLRSQYELLDWVESGADVSEILWYIACTTYYSTMRHLKDFYAVYRQTPPEFDHAVSPEHFACLPGILTPKPYLPKQLEWAKDEDESRKRISMATLLDTMMASLGLQSSGRLNSLEDVSAAAERVDGVFSTGATQFSKVLQLVLTDRFCESFLCHTFLHQHFASEFLGEFADEAVKRLLTSCIAPRAAPTATENIPTLVMPFRACAQSFEFSRPPSELFDDTLDLISDAIVNSVMQKISERSDYESDAELSDAEETPESDSHSSEKLRTSPPAISVDALRCCIRAILEKVQEMSSTGAHGSPLLINEDQVQNVTTAVKEMLSLFTAVTVEDGEHALKKLHRSIIDAVYAELVQRIKSENQLIEAVKTQSEQLAGSLAVSIVKAIKNADRKDLYCPSSVQSGSSSSIQEEPLFSSQPTDMILKSQDSNRGFKSDRQHRACLTTWLVLRVLGQLELSSDLTKEASSNDPKELTERILRELSASSSAEKLEEVLNGVHVELLQRFGEEGSRHKALNPQDSAFDEALMTALRKHLGVDASAAVPETKEVKSIPSKKRKGIFFHLKMPKLFQKKSRKHNDDHTDQDPLQSRHTAAMGGSSSATSKKEKPRKPSIFRRMFSCFRKAVLCF
ncbi:hypothetical protein MHYP_G00090150 [Metynnis hypsauchen]